MAYPNQSKLKSKVKKKMKSKKLGPLTLEMRQTCLNSNDEGDDLEVWVKKNFQ